MILDQLYPRGISESRQRKLIEAQLLEDPVYRSWQRVGQLLVEKKLTEPEILDIFKRIETGQTAAGGNRTIAGRAKDTTVNAASAVKNAVTGVLNSIQTSAPVAAVDVAYDKATDALANLTGGQKGAAMEAIKKYRMLAKEYPKTAGFAKAALVAIAGLATGGAGLPAIAGLTYALDSAIRGDKLSSVLGKGAGASALAWAGQQAAGMIGNQPGADNVAAPTDTGAPPTDTGAPATDAVPSRFDEIVSNSVDYKVKPGDTLSDILADRKINPEAFRRLPGNDIFFSPDGNPNILKAGQTIKLPDPSDIPDLNRMSYTTPDPANYARFDKEYDTTGYTGQYNPNNSSYSLDATNNLKQQGMGRFGSDGGIAADRVAQDAVSQATSPILDPNTPPAAGGAEAGAGAADTAGRGAAIDYSQKGPVTTDSLGQKLEYGIPVNDKGAFVPPNSNLPAEELARQQAAYDAWKSDYMKRWPNAVQLPDGSMQGIKPGLAPMFPSAKVKENYLPKNIYQVKPMPFVEMVNQRRTVHRWALNESRGQNMGNSVVLSYQGVLHVIEQTANYHNRLVEYVETGPGRDALPNLYRPDMSDAPAPVSAKPGLIGRGLNALDRGVKKVGGALSKFGHQLTTKVTADKLKMNWHQGGKPTDSDQLAAWLQTQGVSPEVVSSVYGELGLPAAAPGADANGAATEPAAGADGKSSMLAPVMDPKTGRRLTRAELSTPTTAAAPAPAAPASTTPSASAAAKPVATATPAASGPPGFNATNVMNLPGMQGTKKPAAPANFAGGPTGYSKTTMSVKPASGAPGIKQPAAAAAPTSAPSLPAVKPGSKDAEMIRNLQTPGKASINTGGPNPYAKKVAAESLTWSHNWDPSRSLIKKIRQT